ncbi:MAG: hypothetical protein D6B28_09185 [Gammaproteobacteria bacterium]|nr:MAG: hypothetical protein D6B28_09185 [Gammaproteobacteria bacterium]
MMNYTTNRYREHNYKTATIQGEALDIRPHPATTRGAKVFADLQKENLFKNIFSNMRRTEER